MESRPHSLARRRSISSRSGGGDVAAFVSRQEDQLFLIGRMEILGFHQVIRLIAAIQEIAHETTPDPEEKKLPVEREDQKIRHYNRQSFLFKWSLVTFSCRHKIELSLLRGWKPIKNETMRPEKILTLLEPAG